MTPSTQRWRRSGRRHRSRIQISRPGPIEPRNQKPHPISPNCGEIRMGHPLEVIGMAKSKKTSDQTGRMRLRIEQAIRAIPRGKVSTYGGIAKIAGYPGAARMVARVLQRGYGLPWQRVLGAGGAIKLTGDSAIEQRLRLEAEGVRFRWRRVDIKAYEYN